MLYMNLYIITGIPIVADFPLVIFKQFLEIILQNVCKAFDLN